MTEGLYKVDESTTHLHYRGKTKFILSVLDKIEKGTKTHCYRIFYKDLEVLKDDFFSLFRIVKAAGGLVLNRNSEILLIYRRGSWDMAKGKMEEGETKRESALREVQEETGLDRLQLVGKIQTTYHIYRDKSNRRVVKPSYWYLMATKDMDLVPQSEEDIEQAIWAKSKDIVAGKYEPMYSSIRSVLHSYLQSVS
jgi:8-oxo-dGTP pyrophosphatase MutT (NUDIX family)